MAQMPQTIFSGQAKLLWSLSVGVYCKWQGSEHIPEVRFIT
jgi:hypothetical protein